ncbi:hypothetical protein MCOR25_004796 [Pyricularia grisea]|uniref:6-phosphogluconolactonase n=1 Tax=Pyricularia grisea TaxID=148305 RepID=A0A6P8AT76_PYRGI|nr:uncharacterized protein PgNI_09645 [Pyricularia grisea]KAI6367831.1 hypothetical protein MCOR25_004796 [Pyricularia grisea]TLD05320.1 hypothetical protein PgNI_09645 [Pyricularia grisea]
MLPTSLCLLLSAAASGAVAGPLHIRQASNVTATKQKVIIGGGSINKISIAQFDGAKFNILKSASLPVQGAPTWLAFKEPNFLYSVNENGVELSLFTVDTSTNDIKFVKSVNGSAGVVHLEFNKDKTRMVGASFGKGTVDVWKLGADGSPELMGKPLATNSTGATLGPNKARQDAPHAHQSVLDNSGRFFFVNDLGLDTITIVDSKDDKFKIADSIKVSPGCGPRHGAFYPATGNATHYLLVCEMLNTVIVNKLNYTGNAGNKDKEGVPTVLPIQLISTFGEKSQPNSKAVPGAGEIAVAADGKSVYVSNRLSFDPDLKQKGRDSITQFKAAITGEANNLVLTFDNSVDSQGAVPRMFSLSADKDQAVLFGTNQNAGNGVAAFQRCKDSGKLSLIKGSEIDYAVFATDENKDKAGFGPQFIAGIPSTVGK